MELILSVYIYIYEPSDFSVDFATVTFFLGEENYNIVVATSRSSNFHVKPEAKINMLMVYVTSYSINLYVFENYTAILSMYTRSGCEGDYLL